MPIQQAMQALSTQHLPDSTLYVIGTPIGNKGDITLRALYILNQVDLIACEDTRVTRVLLDAYAIKAELISAHKYNEREMAQKLIEHLANGERIAFVSDAGMPAVSDPGARVVDAVRQAGFNIMPVPGVSAGITALSVSGLMTERFLFVGFLPVKAGQRKQTLVSLKNIHAVLVIYEAPHRIIETITAISQIFEPTRQIVIARELTKLFEEIHRCELSQALDWFKADTNRQKGEFVLLIDGAPDDSDEQENQLKKTISVLLEVLPLSSAVAAATKITGQKKNAIYEIALKLEQNCEQK